MNSHKIPTFVSLLVAFIIGAGAGAFALHASASIQFPDVDSGAFFANAAADMSQLGFITGYENGNFGPNDPVTRGQVAVIMRRMWKELENQGVVDSISSSSAQSVRSTRSASASSSSSHSSSSDNTHGSFRFTVDELSIVESAPSASVSIVRTGGNSGTASVKFETKNGTATGGEDFTINSGTITFADGESTKNISVNLKNDEDSEGSETFTIVLIDPSDGADITSPDTVTVTIIDNEATSGSSNSSSSTSTGTAGKLAFNAHSFSVAENNGKATITVVRTGGTSGEVKVDYATSDGSAKSSDYESANGSLTFASGDTSKTFDITLKDNDSINGNKTFTITLTNPTGGAVLGDKSVILTIIDDEIASSSGSGTLKIDDDLYEVNESDGEVNVIILRQIKFSNEISVSYATTAGTAKAGTDFTDKSGTLTFKAGESSKMITIPIIKDSSLENTESFSIKISSPTSGVTLGSPSTATITIIE